MAVKPYVGQKSFGRHVQPINPREHPMSSDQNLTILEQILTTAAAADPDLCATMHWWAWAMKQENAHQA